MTRTTVGFIAVSFLFSPLLFARQQVVPDRLRRSTLPRCLFPHGQRTLAAGHAIDRDDGGRANVGVLYGEDSGVDQQEYAGDSACDCRHKPPVRIQPTSGLRTIG